MALEVFAKLNSTVQVDVGARRPTAPHAGLSSEETGRMTAHGALPRERGRCLDAASPGDLYGQHSQRLMLRSQPVPLLGQPPCCWRGWGGGGRGTWHWPSLASLPPMFCSQFGMSWDAELGSLGRHWCHPLDLISGQVLVHSSLGLGRLPAPAAASPRPSVSVPALAARSRAAGSRGASRGAGFS